MVLRGRLRGRVGRCQDYLREKARRSAGLFHFRQENVVKQRRESTSWKVADGGVAWSEGARAGDGLLSKARRWMARLLDPLPDRKV